MTLFLAVVLGLLIGLSLGALGGGGSILTVPALVYILGEPARSATTASLVIVGIAALVGSIGHARAGTVKWAPGLVFGLVGVASSYLGTAVNKAIDPNLLLLAFAALMLVAAVGMILRSRSIAPTPAREPALTTTGGRGVTGPIVAKSNDADGVAGGTNVSRRPDLGMGVKLVVAGLAVGFLTGFLGVGGGFVIVPALVMVLGFSMPAAVGTSLVIIAMNSGAALLARAGQATSFHWAVIIPFTAAAIVGSLFGKTIAAKVPAVTLTRAFAGLLVAVAGYVVVKSVGGLTG